MADRVTTPIAREEEPAAQAEEASEAAKKPATTGGLKAWLPLLATVVAMPALAFATTQFVLLPKFKHAIGAVTAAPAEAAPAKDAAAKTIAPGKDKITVAMPKILVNLAGTMGTRYLMTSLTLVGNAQDFKDRIDKNKDQLLDLANGTLGTKTIADLEKPGARNVMRAELLTVFNNALGGPVVQEIYITEQAIQ